MNSFLKSTRELIARISCLVLPFGRRKLARVVLISIIQGVFQVVGVTSIFPFLALASDPDRFRYSSLGKRLFDVFPAIDNTQLLLFSGAFAIGMLFLANGIAFLAMKSRITYGTQFAHWLRLRVTRKIVARPYGDFLHSNSSVFLKKILGDVEMFTNAILMPVLGLVTCFNAILLLAGTLVYVNPKIALYVGSFLVIIYGLTFWILAKWRRQASENRKEAQAGAYKESQQLLAGIKPVKVHCVEEPFLGRFSKHSSKLARVGALIPLMGQIPRLIIEPFALGTVIIVVMYYVVQRHDLALILPSLVVMAMAGYRLLPNIQMMYSSMTSLGTARHALDEIYEEIFAIESQLDLEDGAKEGRFVQAERLEWNRAITLKDITFQYPSAPSPVIHNLNLVIKKNSSLGIIGSTGSGKSTLVDLLLGLHIPTGGCIQVDEAALISENRRSWRAGIGYVPQDIYLLDDSISANIAFGVPKDKINHDSLIQAAKAAQINTFIEDELPEGYQTFVGERGVRLSGGQRQRIGLARALYHQPDVLILDEATSALDIATEAEVMKAIDTLQGSLTLIIIAHRLSTVEKCETLLDMSEIRQ
jgi:ABC-type multidrug transport system fused ATPase/permease subunit